MRTVNTVQYVWYSTVCTLHSQYSTVCTVQYIEGIYGNQIDMKQYFYIDSTVVLKCNTHTVSRGQIIATSYCNLTRNKHTVGIHVCLVSALLLTQEVQLGSNYNEVMLSS